MPRLLVFSTDDCHVCKHIKPMVEDEAQKKGIAVEEHDPISEPALAQRFDVLSVPTLVLLSGNEFLGELRGFVNESSLKELFSFA